MKITLDSTEPLEDAIRVLGAMYGVQLMVSTDQNGVRRTETDSGSESIPADKAAQRQGRSRSRGRRPAAGGGAPRSAKAEARSVASPAGRPSNAQVRTWARENGMAVSDRGRLAGSVIAAYRTANSK